MARMVGNIGPKQPGLRLVMMMAFQGVKNAVLIHSVERARFLPLDRGVRAKIARHKQGELLKSVSVADE